MQKKCLENRLINHTFPCLIKTLHKIDFDAVPSLHLLDSLIAQILNYNSQMWSQLSKQNLDAINNNDYKLVKLFFDTPGEKLLLQFCRKILGVANKTSIAAILGELGCYPLLIKCFTQMIKHLHHIRTEVDHDTLI